jgi:hypothetical protein
MFIKTIVKTDLKSQKVYEYLRLCESYRLGDKTRHNTIVSMGLQPYLILLLDSSIRVLDSTCRYLFVLQRV